VPSEIWRAKCLDGEVTPSPIFAAGTLYIVNPTVTLQAIRPDGHRDVTKTHIGWVAEDGIPEVSSPVSDGKLVFVVSSAGLLTCYDAQGGRKQWDHDFEDDCSAAPSLVGDKLYLITKKGTLAVVEASRQFKERGRSALGDRREPGLNLYAVGNLPDRHEAFLDACAAELVGRLERRGCRWRHKLSCSSCGGHAFSRQKDYRSFVG
jgi:outer membrane protein assembly factor BamB